MFMYSYYKGEYSVWLNALISETTGLNSKHIFVSDSPFIEEGYKLNIITLRSIGTEQQRKMSEKRENYSTFDSFRYLRCLNGKRYVRNHV